MASPSRYKSGSPVRTLDQKYYTRPLQTILQENTALRVSNSLIFQNQCLQKENERLYYQFNRTKDNENQYLVQNQRLQKERMVVQQNYRTLEARTLAENQAKQRLIDLQQRDMRLLKQEFVRQNQALKDQIINLNNKIALLEANKLQDMQILKSKYINTTNEETNFIRKNMGEELKHVFSELQITRQILGEKQRQLNHLVIVSQQNSSEYAANLQRFISQNNVLRNQLLTLEFDKNKQIQLAENKKELEKSRTIGILSYTKENNHFIQKELTRLSEQLLEKNITIQSLTKELLKEKKQAEHNERKFEESVLKLKQQSDQAISDKDKQIERIERESKQDLAELRKTEAELMEQLDTKNHQLQTNFRQMNYLREQVIIKDKEIDDLKQGIARLHQDHSKQLSKVMVDSRVKRRSGLNMSSYSSSSLKDIQQPQGSSILKSGGIDRKLSFSNEGSGKLPVVKEQLAVSRGHIDDDQGDEDIQIKELILHYESMIQELKKNKHMEVNMANENIDRLKNTLNQKQQQIIDILNRFSPLMELKINKMPIQQQRKLKIEQNYKADISILSVLLDKYSIVSLRPRAT